MNFDIQALSYHLMRKWAHSLSVLDQKCVREDPFFADEAWGQENYLRACTAKWELSKIVFDRDQKPIGALIATETNKKYCHINRVLVDSNHRGHGIAYSIMDAFKQSAFANGYSYATLFVQVSNEKAIRLYAKAGWTISSGASFKELAALKICTSTLENTVIHTNGIKSYIMLLDI